MHDRGNRRVVEGQRDRSDLLDTLREAANELLLAHVENVAREHLTVVKDLHNRHTVRERRDVEQVQQSRLGLTDTVARLNDPDVRDNFNRTTGNLGGHTKSLEEGRLTGFHTRVTGRHVNIHRRKGTSTSRSSHTVRNHLVTHLLEVARREHETNVATHVGHQALKLWALRDDLAQGTTHHRVLTHKHRGLTTQRLTDLVHLLRADVVNVHNEDRRVRVDQLVEPGEPVLLRGTSNTHFCVYVFLLV